MNSQPQKIIQPASDLPELTEEEIEIVLRTARQKKQARLLEEQYWEKVRRSADPAPALTKTAFLRIILKNIQKQLEAQGRKEINLDDGRKSLYEKLAAYFTGDPLFEEDGFSSLSRGIMLMGSVGVGKSAVMKACEINHRQPFHMVDVVALCEDYKRDSEILTRYRNLHGPRTSDPWRHDYSGFCFDDFGWEESPVLTYGNPVNVMEKIIGNIYSRNIPWHCIHVTTNLTARELQEKYGERLIDRMRQMFNQMDITGKSLR